MAELTLSFYDTLTRSQRQFTPIDAANVRMYVCGPTVYDFAHIGNARPVIMFDVLFRLLQRAYGESAVTYTRNITDVDDKINARALRDYADEIASGALSLNEAIAEVTQTTTAQFHADIAALGCVPPTYEPKATEHIEGMILMINQLMESGNAYLATGQAGKEILFSVESMPDYGALSNRKLEDQQAGARVAVKDHKRHASDFVLWKQAADKEPGWDAKFGDQHIRGRPGWHIECSVMSKHFLGEVFDIHAGGIDLVFPHHENEIAQSRCCSGEKYMANYWLHNGFLQVEGRKMSKSEGNFITINDLLETDRFGGRSWPCEVLRFAMMMTHYREPIDFSLARLTEAENILARLWRRAEDAESVGDADDIDRALADDLNTCDAIRVLNQMAGKPLKQALEMLGLPPEQPKTGIDESEIQTIIEERLNHIKEKNWAVADQIRDDLIARGIQLKDGKDAATGERVTTWEVCR
ncbi:MAG: cysteine--tRNA ligase [Pseudomonadota bacterium]